MNILDIGIILVLGVFFLIGYYKGFVYSVMNVAAFLLAWIIALSLYPAVANVITKKTDFTQTMLYYTSGGEKISDYGIASLDVSALTADKITKVITDAKIPAPMDRVLKENILNQKYLEDGLTTMRQYFDHTLAEVALNIASFLLVYLAVRLICAIIIKILDNVVQLPVLKQLDSVMGGSAGVLVGIFFFFVVFSVMPIVLAAVPNETIEKMVNGSLLCRFFYKANIISNLVG